MSSLQSLSDYGLGESDIEDSDEEVNKEDAPVITFVPKVQVYQPRVVTASSRLVSYGEDDEDEGKPSEIEVDDSTTIETLKPAAEEQDTDKKEENTEEKEVSDVHSSNAKVQLPPEPIGRCSNTLQDKMISLLEKKHRTKINWNAAVQKKKNFRNPSIYEKLISYCNIQENGTNYPKELFDPEVWAKEPNYEALAKLQKEANEKREKAKRTHIEFLTGTKKPASTAVSDEAKKRKSKWDISAAGVPRTATPPIPPGVGIVPGLAKVISEAAASAAKKAKLDN